MTQLVKEKDFQKAIFDCLQEGIVVVGSDQRVVFANEASRGLLGLGGRKITGESLRSLIKAKALVLLADEFEEHRHPISHQEIRVRTPASRIYSVSIIPVGEKDGVATHSVWIISDQTETHRRAAERHQQESIRSLATLTAGIAHEIKNPLNSMNIHAQLIAKAARDFADTQEPSPQLERLDKSTGVLLEEISRLARIVDQFIKAVRPVKLSQRPTNINTLLNTVADLIRPECHARHIELELDLDPVMPLINLDGEQLHQAILNVAKNGMEAIDKPEGRLVLRSMVKSDLALIEIEDNGCGIPEAERLTIFEPYHTTKFEGSGLGLMVVFRIVSAHKGALGLDSEVGQGTVFKIALPLDERPVRLLNVDAHPETVIPTDLQTS